MDTKLSTFAPTSSYIETSTATTLNYPYAPFVFNYINKFSMPCGALTLDAYQKYYLAASACQMAWTYGAADSCTGSGFTYQIFSFPSYAVSSSGIDYSVFQGTGDICVEATFGGSDELAVVVTDDAKWNGIFKFTKTMRSVPRFLQTHIQTVSSSGTFAHLTVPVSTFPATGFFTFSILKLTPVSLVWNLAGYTGDYMHDFHNPSALNTPEVKNGNFAYGGTDLAQAIGQYQTVVATKFVKHDQTNAFSCQVGVTFKGVIRALYVDSKFILAGSSGDASVSITLNSEVNADFSPNVGSVSTAATVTILGHYLKITTLSFSSCSDGVNSVTPTFTNYVHDLTYAGSQLYYWKVTDTACGSGCLSCLDTTTCFECDSSHFLLGTNCVYNCNDPTYFVAAKDKYCRSTFANQGLTRTIPSYSGGAITFDVVVNPFRYAFGVFTLIYPKGISIVNYPIIVHDNTKPIALVEGSMKGTIVSTAVQEPLFNAQTVNVVNVATALNQDVRLVTISVYPDFYYYFTVLSGGPQLIGYRQSTPYGNSISMSVSDVYQAHVIIDAPSGGELTVEFLGQLEVLLNHVTVIFSATFATQTSYTLVKSLPTGISYLTFKGTGSTYFDFSIVGSGIKTYNPVSFLHEETLTIPVSTATAISNCLNGAAPVCRSCIGTYYLSPDESECNSNCDSVGGTPVAEERLCDGVVVTPGPGTTANPTKLPVPKAVEVFQSVDETRKISNEVFSVVSSIGFQGVHSIRSQTVQGPLGYFMFINIKFPWNYIQFAAKNQDSNMPNPWGKDDNKDNEDIDEAYENQSNIDAFLEDQTLAVNIGETMIYLLVCVLIIPVYEGIVWLLVRYKKPETPTKWYHSVLEKGSKSLRWSFLMNQFISKYQDITFFVFLGIYNAGRGENTDAGNTVGSVLGFILVVSVVVGLFFLIKEIQKALKDYDEEQIEKEKFKDNDYLMRRLILFKDFKKDKLITLLYTFFAVLRVFGFCFCVIFISSVVGIQLAFLNISSFLIIFYLLYYKPFDETVQLRLTLVYEFVFYAGVLAATILQIYMSAGGHDETTKTGFGYAIIAADVGMTVLNFISFYMEIKEYAEVTYEYLKLSYKKVRNKKKVIPLPAEGEKRSVKNENLKTEDGSPGLAELGKASSKLGNGDVTSQDLLSPSTSMSKLVFPSSINDPKRPSLRNRTRHSLMREQVFSIIEAKEENDILIDGSNIKSPKDFDSTRLHVNHGWDSPDGKNRRKRLSKRDARLSISTDKDTAELIGPQGGDNGDNGDVEITKLV